eukprot:TRINITY_DN242_c10_g1_i1.p1 TRINITY_DN242_c10_g1~~TRINITY_DN242_c10_g1_i1.p1  ORF type:complete len:430 (+),score=174.18 TRINITY_DN242_c10_g1_i1:85-1290(+)
MEVPEAQEAPAAPAAEAPAVAEAVVDTATPPEAQPEPATEAPAEAAAATEAPVVEKKENKWGGWGEDPDETLLEMAQNEPVQRGNALLDELAVDDGTTEEEREVITGPDGYQYPPLTKHGIDILRRMWAGELPDNRVDSVQLWEKKVRCAVAMSGLAIPVPPRVPATELLNRPAAAIKAETANKDLSRWVIPEDEQVEYSPEMEEFNAKGIVPETVTKMLEKRLELRAQRNYEDADRIRNDLFAMGVEFNDVAMQWRSGDHQGTFGQGFVGQMYQGGGGGGNMQDGPPRPPIEIQDIDMPGTWEDFLGLADPKVLAVGPRSQANGKRAWGAGGMNWGTSDQAQAAEQAIANCAAQGVHRPKIIWPPHLVGAYGKGGKGKGGGGKGMGMGMKGGKGGFKGGY